MSVKNSATKITVNDTNNVVAGKATRSNLHKQRAQEFYKLLPILTPVVILLSIAISAIVAWHFVGASYFYTNVLSFESVFINVFKVCIVIYTVAVVYSILSKGKD
jgi:hypothetical protein